MATIGTNIGRIEFVIYALNDNGVRDTFTATTTLYLEDLMQKSLEQHLDAQTDKEYQSWRETFGHMYSSADFNAKVYLNGEPKMFCQQRMYFYLSKCS